MIDYNNLDFNKVFNTDSPNRQILAQRDITEDNKIILSIWETRDTSGDVYHYTLFVEFDTIDDFATVWHGLNDESVIALFESYEKIKAEDEAEREKSIDTNNNDNPPKRSGQRPPQ